MAMRGFRRRSRVQYRKAKTRLLGCGSAAAASPWDPSGGPAAASCSAFTISLPMERAKKVTGMKNTAKITLLPVM